jgi:hypothetical protein
MKKLPLNKLVIETLKEPFYFNIVKFKDEEKWYPCWEEKYYGSTRRLEAVKLRKEFLKFLQTEGNPNWSDKDLKTVKIEYYKSF